jgi:hypothetical protein
MYAIALTEVSIYSWLVIIMLAILNYIRIITVGSQNDVCHYRTPPDEHHDDHHDDHATDDHADDGHRMLSSGDDGAEFHVEADCADYYIGYFIFCGCLLFFMGVVISIITHNSEGKLLDLALNTIVKNRRTKSDDIGRALKALAGMESAVSAARAERYQRGASFSGTPANSGPEASPTPTLSELDPDMADMINDDMCYHMVTLRAVLKASHHAEKTEHLRHQHENEMRMHKLLNLFCCHSKDLKAEDEKRDRINELRNRQKTFEMSMKRNSHKAAESPFRNGVRRSNSLGSKKEEDGEEWANHPLNCELNDVFVGGSREVYRHVIEAMLMLDALFLSLWVTHFILIAYESHSPKTYLTMSVLPILGNFVVTSYIQYHSNMLLAVTSLKNEVAVWMCEQDHIKSKTLPLLRREVKDIMEGLPQDTSLEETIATIFELVNMDGDDRIVLNEFASLLFTLDIHLEDTETRVLFSAMDTDGRYYHINLDHYLHGVFSIYVFKAYHLFVVYAVGAYL